MLSLCLHDVMVGVKIQVSVSVCCFPINIDMDGPIMARY